MINKKYFIITIDTEGDNLWTYRLGNTITTENARYIPRFQDLCNRFNFKPVYLTNYEMAQDNYFVAFAQEALAKNICEIGLHIHAWNTPPYYELKSGYIDYGLPYLIEYPSSVMREKIDTMINLLRSKFNTDIISHRSGRWATNQDYFDMLIDYGLKIDCSLTPHISWKSVRGYSSESKGSDYRTSSENPFMIKSSTANISILEVPVTIRTMHRLHFQKNIFHIRSCFNDIRDFACGKPIWIRPNGGNLSEICALINQVKNSDSDYLMFMLHSSELMPGGSPAFKNARAIENLYRDIEIIFTLISENIEGIILKNYYNKTKKEHD